jgi:hypothetical protein
MIGLGLSTCREDRCRRNTFRSLSSIPRQLAVFPMVVFPVGVEHALDVSVQRPQHLDPGNHEFLE